MLKSTATIEIKGTQKRVYTFYYDPSSPLGEVYDSICSMRLYVLEQMKLQDMRETEKRNKLESFEDNSE